MHDKRRSAVRTQANQRFERSIDCVDFQFSILYSLFSIPYSLFSIIFSLAAPLFDFLIELPNAEVFYSTS